MPARKTFELIKTKQLLKINKMKRIITLTLMLCTVFTMSAQFSGSGTGTSSDPYRIFNADQLTQMRNFLNQEGVYFKLQNDINLTDWLADN